MPLRFRPENPKLVGSACHARYARYSSTSTTAAFFDLATSKEEADIFFKDLVHDIGKGFAYIYLPTFARAAPARSPRKRRQPREGGPGGGGGSPTRRSRRNAWPTHDLPFSLSTALLPTSRPAARTLTHDGCEKVIVSFTFARTEKGFAAAAAVDALRSSDLASSDVALRFPVWRGARLLATKDEVGEGKHRDHVAGPLHGLLLGLHAAADLGAQSVEAYGPYHPELGRLLDAPLDPQRGASRAHVDADRLRSFMSRFSSVSLFDIPSDVLELLERCSARVRQPITSHQRTPPRPDRWLHLLPSWPIGRL